LEDSSRINQSLPSSHPSAAAATVDFLGAITKEQEERMKKIPLAWEYHHCIYVIWEKLNKNIKTKL